MSEPEKDFSNLPHAKIALKFAQLICEEKYDDAHKMLSDDLKKVETPEVLKSTHRRMLSYLDDEDEDEDDEGDEENDGENTLPRKDFQIPQDYLLEILMTHEAEEGAENSWAYCSVRGEDYSEAIAVSVIPDMNSKGEFVIARIDWGRP